MKAVTDTTSSGENANVQAVQSCVTSLKRERARLQARLFEIERVAKRIEAETVTAVPEENDIVEESMLTVGILVQELEGFMSHLDDEIAKMEGGALAFKEHADSAMAAAFRDYIMEDTKLSLGSITMTRYDYDHAIVSLKEFERTLRN